MIKSWNHYLIVGFTEGGSGSGASLLSLFGQALVVAGGLNIPPWKEDIFLYFHENFQEISIFELTFDATVDNGSHEKNTQYDEKGNPCGLEKIEAFFSREVVGVVDDDRLDDLKNCEKNTSNSNQIFYKNHSKFSPRVLLRDLPLPDDAPRRRGPRRYFRKS